MIKPVPKPTHARNKPKRRNITRITNKARHEVLERSEGKCECCGISNPYSFEVAHIIQASQLGRGDDPANLLLLCGPSVNSGTCHHWVDSTSEGREWAMRKREELMSLYER